MGSEYFIIEKFSNFLEIGRKFFKRRSRLECSLNNICRNFEIVRSLVYLLHIFVVLEQEVLQELQFIVFLLAGFNILGIFIRQELFDDLVDLILLAETLILVNANFAFDYKVSEFVDQ